MSMSDQLAACVFEVNSFCFWFLHASELLSDGYWHAFMLHSVCAGTIVAKWQNSVLVSSRLVSPLLATELYVTNTQNQCVTRRLVQAKTEMYVALYWVRTWFEKVVRARFDRQIVLCFCSVWNWWKCFFSSARLGTPVCCCWQLALGVDTYATFYLTK